MSTQWSFRQQTDRTKVLKKQHLSAVET
jgi:hypothetical protein